MNSLLQFFTTAKKCHSRRGRFLGNHWELGLPKPRTCEPTSLSEHHAIGKLNSQWLRRYRPRRALRFSLLVHTQTTGKSHTKSPCRGTQARPRPKRCGLAGNWWGRPPLVWGDLNFLPKIPQNSLPTAPGAWGLRAVTAGPP